MGDVDRAKAYAEQFNKLAAMFKQAFASSQLFDIGVQTDLAIAVDLGIADEVVKAALIKDVMAHDLHFTTGIIGVKTLMPTLSALNRTDIAFDVAAQVTYPSWGYEGANTLEPATTVWELMDAPVEVSILWI